MNDVCKHADGPHRTLKCRHCGLLHPECDTHYCEVPALRAEAEGLRRERDDLKALADKAMNERDAAEDKAKFERERANEWLAQKHDAEKRLAATAAVEIARDLRAALAALVSSPRPEVLSPSALICRKGGDIKHIHVNDCFGPVTAPRPEQEKQQGEEGGE